MRAFSKCGFLFGCALFGAAFTASSAVTWPATMGDWTRVTMGGGNDYTDVVVPVGADSFWATPQDKLDVVGGLDFNGTSFTAGFWASDGVNLFLRIRCDNPPIPTAQVDPESVWTVLLDTDVDDFADFALQLDHQIDERVEIGTTTDFGPSSATPWGAVNDMKVNSQIFVGSIADNSRFQDATDLTTGDGSNFHTNAANDHDYFTDLAITWLQFSSVTGLTPGDSFSVAFGTSSDHVNLNKDKPDNGWSDSITVVPEPTMMSLLAIGGLMALFRRRG